MRNAQRTTHRNAQRSPWVARGQGTRPRALGHLAALVLLAGAGCGGGAGVGGDGAGASDPAGLLRGAGLPGEAAGTPATGQRTVPADADLTADLPVWPIPALRLPELPPAAEAEPDTAAAEPLVRIRLSDGPDPGPAPARTEELPPPEPLPRTRVEELLARLPAASAVEAPSPDGPGGPDPPVRPPGGAASSGAAPPPRVHSVLPVGTVDVAPWVTVVFSDAMVPLGSDGEPMAGDPPARLDPAPPGRWRWLDVRTLRFEPEEGRLPGATEYAVHVPAGTPSARGAGLDEDLTARFTTRGAMATGGWPRAEIVDLEPTILVVFDQRVRARDVLAAARLLADDVLHPLRLADPSELDEAPRLRAAAEEAPEGRWVVLRPERPLSPGAEVRLVLGPELASAEGPHPTGRPQELVFFSRRDMELDTAQCTDLDARCDPARWWWAAFSNPLDPESVTEDRFRVEPAVDGLRVWVRGRQLMAAGDFLPHRSYRVRLDGEIRDSFGQRLGDPVELEIHFGPPGQTLRIPGAPFLTLDPREPARIEVHARAVPELLVEVFRVEPEDWEAYVAFQYPGPRDAHPDDPPGTRVATARVQAPDGGRGVSRVPVELGSALRGGAGQAIVRVRQAGSDEGPPQDIGLRQSSVAWVQATRLGVDAVWDTRRVTARVHSLLDGEPVAGAQVHLPGSGVRGDTDGAGLVTLTLTEARDSILVARAGGETAILPHHGPVIRRPDAWTLDPEHPGAAWSVFTDRGIYQPGEEGRIHGWLREPEGEGDRGRVLPSSVDSIRYQIRFPGPQEPASGGSETREGSVPVSPLGAFHLPFRIPEEVQAGRATVDLNTVGSGGPRQGWRRNLSFQVEEFRRPEYQVTVESEPDLRFVGEPLDVRVEGRYFDGPPLVGAEVSWRVGPSLATHIPSGWRGWSFSADFRSRPDTPEQRNAAVATLETRANADGVHHLHIEPDLPLFPYPLTLDVRSEVRDLDRQAGSAGTTILLHPASAYAGIRIDAPSLIEGDTLTFGVVVVDPEGAPVSGLVPQVRIERVEAGGPQMSWLLGPLEVLDAWSPDCQDAVLEGPDELEVPGLRCRHPTSDEGLLRVAAEVEDARGRRARAEGVVVVQPVLRGGVRFPGARWNVPGEGLEVESDKDTYEPGDTAHLRIASAVYPARGTAAMIYSGVRRVVPVRLDGPETELELALGEGQLGRNLVQVALWSPDRPEQPLRANASFDVSMEHRRLQVRAEAEVPEAAPGDEIPVRVTVRDARGVPVSDGEVTLWLVDEAILALARYRAPDPLRVLNGPALGGTGSRHLADHVLWARRARGPGWLTGRLVNGETGGALAGHVVRLPGLGREVRTERDGEFAVEEVPAGSHLMEFLARDEVVARREVLVATQGTDVGELLVVEPPQPPRIPGEDRPPGLDSLRAFAADGRPVRLALQEVIVAATDQVEGLRLPFTVARATEPMGVDADPVTIREDFSPLAAFEAALRTDEDGQARALVRLPDTPTRYRILAVAVRGAREFGTGEGELVARRDFLVRPAFPRFMHPGDRSELSVLVQNLTDRDEEVEVAARAFGLELEGSGGVRLRVPAGDRREVRLPARAISVGDARVEAVAAMALEADAVGVSVPVRPALAPRNVALYSRLDEGEALRLPLGVPPGTLPGVGAVEVALSTSLLQSFTDELLLLFREPDLGPDPTVARLMAAVALHDRFDLVRSEGLPTAAEMKAQIDEDIRFLTEAFGPWRMRLGSGPIAPWRGVADLTLLSALDGALALQRAAQAGFEVPEALSLEIGMTLDQHLRWLVEWWSRHEGLSRRYLLYRIAYTGYVHRELMGSVSPWLASWAAELAPEDLPSESLAWLYAVFAPDERRAHLAQAFRAALLNRLLMEAGTATFRTGPSATVPASAPAEERLLFDSRRRTDAVVLSVLLGVEPDLPLLPAVVRGLLGHRDEAPSETVLGSIYEAGWLLKAVGDYAQALEEGDPDLTARARLDDELLAEEIFRGRSLRSALVTLPVDRLALVDGDDGERASLLTVDRSGTGALYVRAGLSYAPADPFQPPEDRGFVVTRRYEAVDDPSDVRRDEDGTWRIRAGARVRVRVALAATARRYQVRLRDPLPAGVEAINPRLEGAPLPTLDDGPSHNAPVAAPPCVGWPLRGTHPASVWANWTECMVHRRLMRGLPWYTYQELRRDRMEAHTSLLPPGTYETTYLVRATVPGSYVAAPPQAWEARHPETRGRGEADRVVVEVRR